MTAEEMQRAMDFIIEMQLKSSAKIDALAQAQKHDQKEAEERWTRTEEGIRALLAIAELHEKEITTLGEHTRATDDRLNALINIVERQIGNERNGKK